MARSPAEEDASTGPGGWPRRPRYAVGDEVEVILTEKGFRGARFEATVTARLPGSGDYEVVYSDLVEYRGGPPLLEVVSAANVRPRPLPPPPERDIDMFDLVEVYHNNGWWPGVVSGVLPKQRQKQQTRFAVSLPLFREVLEVSASLVRPRREFVCGSWIDAQEVLRGIPLYPEGSSVEVMSDKEKKGTAWRPATIVKMVGGTNYIVRYGNENSYIEVLHSCFIRPQPSAELMLEHELGPSAKVEVYHDGIWSLGVIADAVSCEPRRYRVMIQQHNNAYGDDCLLVSSAFLRPYSKRDSQEWRLRSTKKHARKRNYSDSDYSVESTPGGNSDQYSSISNKRMRKEELHLRHSLNLRQDTARSSVKDAMDMEISSVKHISRVMKLESETGGLAFRVAKEKDQILEGNSLEKLIYTRFDGKGTHALPKVLASKRKDLFCASSHGDTIEISSKTDVVVISDDSGYGNFIEISDGSSYKPKRKKTRMNLTIGHSNHLIHDNQAQHSASNLWQVHNSYYDLLLQVTSHSEEHACTKMLSHSMAPPESSQVPSHRDGAQEIRLPGCQVKELLGKDETDEQQLSDHLLIENVLMALDDSAGEGENYEMSAKVTEVISCVAGTCNEEADAGLTSPKNSNQKTVDQSYSGAFSIGKLEPSSCRQHDVEGDLICIESPNGNKAVIKDERTSVSPKEAALPIGKLEPPSSEQQDVKADLLCIQASNDIKMEMTNARTGMSPEATAGFHSETSKEIVVALHAECNDSSQHPLGPLLEPVFQKSAGPSPFLHPGVMVDLSAFMPLTVPNSSAFSPVFSTTSLLLMSNHKMEVFNKLPQNPHFREACDCPPEFREGRALGLMLSFANMAESIRNMRIQDGQQHYQEKMNSLLDLEGNGFDVRALKIRLDNLLRVRNHHIHLKSRKESLEKEIFEMKGVNCALERHLKFLDSIMWVAKKYQEMKTSVGIQKAANCSSISKLQVDLHQVEESLVSAEANICSIAAAPWQSEPDLNYGNPSKKSGEVPLLPYT